MKDEEILKVLENHLKQVSKTKKYVKDQLDFMKKTYPNENHGILVLNYIYRVMLKDFKEEMGED